MRLLSFGVFLILIAGWIGAWVLGVVALEALIPLILLSAGAWALAVAGLQAFGTSEGGEAFTTFGWGMLFVVVGGTLYLVTEGLSPAFILVFVLALAGFLAVVSALRIRMR
jgi:hypothetical protein